jgi:glycosyltransferase involved in cell wall biosynthesis
MNDTPKISIIVPVYKVEKYLRRCLDSILYQTFTEYECILVDDGSPDGCPAICDEYAAKDGRFKVIHKRNAGLGLARNSGMEIAAGEFVAFVDSDDFLYANTMYEVLYRVAKEKNLDTVYCNACFYKDENHITPRKEVNDFVLFHGRDEVDSFLLDMIGPVPSFVRNVKYLMSVWRADYSMEIIKRHKIRFVSERELISEDIIFHIEYLRNAEMVGFLPDIFYCYCYNQNSLTGVYKQDRFNRNLLLLNELEIRLSHIFHSVYKIHWMRLFLHCTLSSIMQEVNYFPIISYARGIKNIKDICGHIKVREIYNNYPYKQLPIKHRVLFLFIKHKCIYPVVLLLIAVKIIQKPR